MSLSSLEEVERWVLSWGEHATVLGPARLKTSICTQLASLSARYAAKR
jgi:predicted DNA-binding transcriptional regulator YafY